MRIKNILFAAVLLIVIFCLLSITSFAQTIPTWAKSIGGTIDDSGYGIVVDGAGNVYITGWFQNTADFDPGAGVANLTSAGSTDIFFAKYDTSGNYLWAKKNDGVGNDQGSSIAVDGSGNVYITGYFQNTADFDPGTSVANLTSAGAYDIFFAKYDANGNYLWAKRIGNINNDYGYGITVSGGNVYITGRFQFAVDFNPGGSAVNLTSIGIADIYFAKYDATSGNCLWAKNIGSALSYCIGRKIAVDVSGNVYITGMFENTTDFDPGAGTANLTSLGYWDIFFAKYDASGNYIWAKSIGSTTSTSDDFGYSIAVDGSGNVYITGHFQGTADFDPGAGTYNLTSSGNYDIFFAKYDASGNYLWAKRIGSTGKDCSYNIVVDGSNIYITGFFNVTVDFDPGAGTANLISAGAGAGGIGDIYFAKYDGSGNYLWAKRIGSIGDDQGYGIAVDGANSVYITGSFTSTVDFDPEAGTTNLVAVGVTDIFFAKYCGDAVCGPLPIKLLTFTATAKDNNTVKTEWATASESNNNYFTIERSLNAVNFESIGTMRGAGNSNTILNYEFIDEFPSTHQPINSSTILYYRLKQTDYDGKYEYSEIVSVTIKQHNNKISIIPNPATNNVTVKFYANNNEDVIIIITDITGRDVIVKNIKTIDGLNNVNVNISGITDGMYFIKVQTEEEQVIQKLIKLDNE